MRKFGNLGSESFEDGILYWNRSRSGLDYFEVKAPGSAKKKPLIMDSGPPRPVLYIVSLGCLKSDISF